MTQRKCSLPDCSRQFLARGFCRRHYYRWYTNGDPTLLRDHREPELLDRLMSRVEKRNGCWHWIGRTNTGGYGQFGFHGKLILAHRASWIVHCGPIHDGLHVCHKCDNRICVNPEHLFLGTDLDNMRDCVAKGRYRNPNAEKTNCKRGHPLSGPDVHIRSNGRRECRPCERIRRTKKRGLQSSP